MKAALSVLVLAACHTTGEVTHEDGPPTAVDALMISSVDASVGSDGVLEVPFDIGADTTAFALEGTLPDDEYLRLRDLRDPAGTVVIDCSEWNPDTAYNLTDACWEYSPMILDYPILADQHATPGSWIASFTTDADAGTQATMTLIQRPPDADEVVDLYAQLLIADGLPKKFRDPSVYDESVQHWMDLWGDLGIVLHPRWGTVDIGPAHSGDMGWRETADAAGAIGELTIVFTQLKEPGVLGYVTAAPGPILPGKDGVLVVDVPAHAGRDGKLSSSEADTLGETIAHEALHGAGIYHPADGDSAPNEWDALDDTLECVDWDSCDEALGANLMYWTTLYDDDGDRIPQVELTDGQRYTAHHWAGGL